MREAIRQSGNQAIRHLEDMRRGRLAGVDAACQQEDALRPLETTRALPALGDRAVLGAVVLGGAVMSSAVLGA
jgi:hypothetical protein